MSALFAAHTAFGEDGKEKVYFMNREENGTISLNACDVNDCYRVAVAPEDQVKGACKEQKSEMAGKTATDIGVVLFGGYIGSVAAEFEGAETLSFYNGKVRGLIYKNLGQYMAKIQPTTSLKYLIGTPETIIIKGGKFAAVKWAAKQSARLSRVVTAVETQVKDSYDPRINYNIAKVLCGNKDGSPIDSKASPNEVSKAVSDFNPSETGAFREAINREAPGY